MTALLLRFRRARGVERQQLTWLLYASAITVAGAIVTRPGESPRRHRLYDIDRLARLRDQVDLQTLSSEFQAVVDQTVQPTRASLWLRPR